MTRRCYVTAIKDFHLPYLRRRVGGFYISRVSKRTLGSRRAWSFHTASRAGKILHLSPKGEMTLRILPYANQPDRPGTIDAFKINENSSSLLNEIAPVKTGT